MLKKRLHFSAIFFVCLTIALAQELPPIKNYSPFDYNADNQNWAISQASNKYIYVGNNAGLLEFNGERWSLYRAPNYTSIRSVKAIDNRIYTGCYMDFGYWERNAVGKLSYTSLSQNIEQKLIEDEQFWNILKFDDWILFISLNRIYIYDTQDKTIRFIEAKVPSAKVFNVGNSILFQKAGEGLFKIEGGEAVLISDDPIFKDEIIEGIFPYENKKALIVTELANFHFLNYDNSRESWEVPAKNQLLEKRIFSCIQLENGNLLLGTISNGLYVLTKEGEFLYKFNKTNGMNNNTVLSLFEDLDHNVWLGLDNGISIINMKSPFNVYNDFKGTLGVVYTAIIFDGYLYLGTNQGVFYKHLETQDDFQFVENTNGQVWSFNIIDNTLFCGHNLGTYIITQNHAEKIADFPGTWAVKKIEGHPNLLMQGNYFGISILENQNGKWQLRNVVDGFNISSRFFELVSNDKLVVNHEQNGVYVLQLDDNYIRVVSEEVEPADGFGSSMFKFKGDLFLSSSSGVMKFDYEKLQFATDSTLTKALFVKNDTITSIIISEADKLWGFTNRNIVSLSQGKFDNEPYVTRIPVPSLFRRTLGVTGFECVLKLENEKYLIGSSTGYLTLDMGKLKKANTNIYINSITVSDLKSQSHEVDFLSKTTFLNKENNFQILFSTPNFNQFSETEYQYQLIGIYDHWSDWSRQSNVTFSNLPHGDYTFKVRSRIGNILSENEGTYSFSIDKPWYLSNLAWVIYAFSFIIFSILVHHIYKRYYTKLREKQLENAQKEIRLKDLENKQQKMYFENEKLVQDIESKNRELAISTMSIIKKNEFLNIIKDELSSGTANDHVQKVIKIIDKNINNEDDWKFFEEAFNNADKDFMKKLKNNHPDLTSNDLRLCAYLRLNLTSKEIAPLLNISPKSVEVKRYRLRKKMNLPHEDSLTDYILGL